MPRSRTPEPDRDTDARVDALYALPLGEFTRARDALAARLRQAGQPERAAEVRRLPKPTPVVWAVNQLARRDRAGVERFLRAVEGLRAAQAGRPAAALGEATEAERGALRALRDTARTLLTAAGFAGSGEMLERVTGTLLGAASRPETSADLRRGRLARELTRPGFEVLAGSQTPAPTAAPRPARGAAEPRRDGRLERLREAARVAHAEATESRRRAEALARAAAEQRRAAAEAARAADEATRAAEQADRAAADARREADRAERKAAEKEAAQRAARE